VGGTGGSYRRAVHPRREPTHKCVQGVSVADPGPDVRGRRTMVQVDQQEASEAVGADQDRQARAPGECAHSGGQGGRPALGRTTDALRSAGKGN